jgi:hypothetical protein
MRIEHVVDPSHAHAQIHQRVLPPAAAPPRRVQAINGHADPQDNHDGAASSPDDAISLDLSPEAREAARQAALDVLKGSRQDADTGDTADTDADDASRVGDRARVERTVQELSDHEREVRAREMARAATAGPLARGATSYTYQVGPDGRLYAVSAETRLDTTEVTGDPEATLRKAEQIQQAASSDDRGAAAVAAAMAARARQELARQQEDLKKSERQLSQNG